MIEQPQGRKIETRIQGDAIMTNMSTWPEVLEQEVSLPQLEDITMLSDGWIKKYLLTYKMPDGSTYEYESVSRKGLEEYTAALRSDEQGITPIPDAICIVPILPDDSLLLIREFRYSVNAWCISFPAGLVDEGETLEECIDRELKEETGFRVRTDLEGRAITPLPQNGYSSVGMGEENVRVVIAYVEQDGDAEPHPTELIEPFVLKRDEAAEFLDKNRDLIGTRCQLLLEAVRRNQVLRKRLVLAQNPIKSNDFA